MGSGAHQRSVRNDTPAEPLPRAVTAPLSAVVLASKVPPIVIGQIMRTSPGPTRHVPAAVTVAPTRLSTSTSIS